MSDEQAAIAIRQRGRQHCSAQVTVRSEAWASPAAVVLMARNISVGGMFIQTASSPPLGSLVDIQIRSPAGGPPHVIAAEVIHVVAPESDDVPGMGVEFLTVADDDRAVLKQLAALEIPESPKEDHRASLDRAEPAAPVAPRPELTAEEEQSAAALRAELGQLKARDPREKLGVPRDSDSKEIRSAFRQLSKRFHPDRYSRYDERVQAIAQEIYLLLSEAELTLRAEIASRASEADSTTAADSTPTVAPPEADSVAARGDDRQPKVRRQEVDALRRRLLRSTLERRQMQQSHVGARKVSAGETKSRSDYVEAGKGIAALREGRYRDARNIFMALVKQWPDKVEYQASLALAQGYMAKSDERTEDALRHFESACEIDPGCSEAIEQARELTGRRRSKARGMLSRLIKRK